MVYNMTFRNVDEILINHKISTATVTEYSYQVSFFINGSGISEKKPLSFTFQFGTMIKKNSSVVIAFLDS